MFNLDKFISDSVTFRPDSMFKADIEANVSTLTREIKGMKVCVIGGAGSIGFCFIKAVLRFEPKSVELQNRIPSRGVEGAPNFTTNSSVKKNFASELHGGTALYRLV